MRGIAATLAVVAATVTATAPAEGQTGETGTVERVTSGESLIVAFDDDRRRAVRLIGIDAPERRHCGGREAVTTLTRLARGRTVTLTPDPALPGTDPLGRAWFYVERGGLDLGLEMLRRGWAELVDTPEFARIDAYGDAEAEALGGVWRRCEGNFALSLAQMRRQLIAAATRFVRRYYGHVSNGRYRAAWRMLLTPAARRSLGSSLRRWRARHRGSRGVRVLSARGRLVDSRPVVRVTLRARARDVCNGRVVTQRFRGRIALTGDAETLAIRRLSVRQVAGGTPRTSKSQCPKPPPRTLDCQGYSPCLPPGPDVDCAGGSGNGPRYVQGPVYVNGSDPYGLDSDGDGVGCES